MRGKKQEIIAHLILLNEDKVKRVTNKRLRQSAKRRKSSYTAEEWAEMAKVRQIKRLLPP